MFTSEYPAYKVKVYTIYYPISFCQKRKLKIYILTCLRFYNINLYQIKINLCNLSLISRRSNLRAPYSGEACTCARFIWFDMEIMKVDMSK